MSSDEENLLGHIESNEIFEAVDLENVNANADENEEKDEATKPVKPKRIVRNPQPKLNEETLKGSHGLTAIGGCFENIKFKGKGFEDKDLDAIMKTYEYWCHRLFPKFPFDSCIERLEKLGNKKSTQTHLKRIRYDLLLEDKLVQNDSDEELADHMEGFIDVPPTQITRQQYQQQQQQQQSDLFDHLQPTILDPSNHVEEQQLTQELLDRIKENKIKATKIRQEKLKKMENERKSIEGKNLNDVFMNQLPGTSGAADCVPCQSDRIGNISELELNSFTESCNENPHSDSMVAQENCFDLESNIKGKNIIKGSKIKKKGRRQLASDTNYNETIDNHLGNVSNENNMTNKNEKLENSCISSNQILSSNSIQVN